MEMIKLLPTFDANEILAALTAGDIAAVAAGYAGEGHRGWTARALYSANHGLAVWAQDKRVFVSMLERLRLSILFARFMSLAPGGVIKEHRDAFLGARVVRLHLPVKTNDRVEMYINSRRCNWRPGELWYGDFSLPHHGVNGGDETRIHLVIDAQIDSALAALFPPGTVPPSIECGLALGPGSGKQEDLSRFEMKFRLQQGFCLPQVGLSPLADGAMGEIRICGAELWVCIEEQPLLRVDPVAEDTADIVGLPLAARLHFVFSGSRALAATLLMEGAEPDPIEFRALGEPRQRPA